MKLIDLNPEWVGHGGEGVTDAAGNPVPRREGVAVEFDCPCECGNRCLVPFSNPIGGGGSIYPKGWTREGDTFETLILSPSIRRIPHDGSCGWHGFVGKHDSATGARVPGEIETCADSTPATPEFVARNKAFNDEHPRVRRPEQGVQR